MQAQVTMLCTQVIKTVVTVDADNFGRIPRAAKKMAQAGETPVDIFSKGSWEVVNVEMLGLPETAPVGA